MQATSRLTSKSQTTIPAAVREALGVKAGDKVLFDITSDNKVELRKVEPLDIAHLSAIEDTLASEWNSKADDEAFADL